MNLRHNLGLCVLALGSTVFAIANRQDGEVAKPSLLLERGSKNERSLSRRVLAPNGGVKEPTWTLSPEIEPPPDRPRKLILTGSNEPVIIEDVWGSDLAVYGEGGDSVLIANIRGCRVRLNYLDPQVGVLVRYEFLSRDYSQSVGVKIALVCRSRARQGVVALIEEDCWRLVALHKCEGRWGGAVIERLLPRLNYVHGNRNPPRTRLDPTAMYEVLGGEAVVVEWSESETSDHGVALMIVPLRDDDRGVEHIVCESAAQRTAGMQGVSLITGSGIRYERDDGRDTIYCTQIVDGKEVPISIKYLQPVYSPLQIAPSGQK